MYVFIINTNKCTMSKYVFNKHLLVGSTSNFSSFLELLKIPGYLINPYGHIFSLCGDNKPLIGNVMSFKQFSFISFIKRKRNIIHK